MTSIFHTPKFLISEEKIISVNIHKVIPYLKNY